ncbi:L-threonylcarbamoyladenylate synthase [Commensalibacter melissae]|uniref:L-threonylcarbamoyladenylate synthase n=1 Tax=Commensalibacter melissae TaxID=2070537 RepID=UPI0012D9BC29|nr:L-threonylcarbamoyladenylate synthase [Commensalibacter melissae]MUG78147.1 threonylcarbamoyl-AMP synthase [Commensalibacter melissae]
MTLLLTNTPFNIHKAASILHDGGLVSFGTETVYGLGADATNNQAIAKIYQAKGRPNFNPLIIHFAQLEHVFQFVEKNDLAYELGLKFWPGPLTLILNKQKNTQISQAATAHLSTMAVRIPNSLTARQLIEYSQKPIAAPSANVSGHVSPTTAQHVYQELNGKIDAVFDSGPCQIGVESTILDVSDDYPKLLRPGGISAESLSSICGPLSFKDSVETKITAPGQLSSHYAPSLTVRLNCTHVLANEALLAFGKTTLQAPLSVNLSPTSNLEEAARNLFANLRFLDTEGKKLGLQKIAVMPIPDYGIGRAICDRLQRAAAPRP